MRMQFGASRQKRLGSTTPSSGPWVWTRTHVFELGIDSVRELILHGPPAEPIDVGV